MAFWRYKIDEKFDKSYEYEDPFYRKKFTMVKYIGSFHTAGSKLKWLDASIENIRLEGDTADVNMKLKVKIFSSPSQENAVEQEVPLRETWVNVDGQWYHVVKKAGLVN